MKSIRTTIAASLALSLMLAGCAGTPSGGQQGEPLSAAERQHKREAIRGIKDKTLAQLFAEKPEAKAELEKAVGYGVFEGTQLNALLYVGAAGSGMLVDNAGGKETFMLMTRAGTGPGIGFKEYRQVLVFKSRGLFDLFRSVGADVSASADATAKLGSKGASLDGSLSFNPELSVYQFTDQGLLLQANWGGVAYLPYTALNE